MNKIKYITDPNKLKDITGFEKYLSDKGYKLKALSDYFNTYNGCSRVWSKMDTEIFIGLIDKPTRIGITHPMVITVPENNGITSLSVDMKYTYLPEPCNYKDFEDKFIKL